MDTSSGPRSLCPSSPYSDPALGPRVSRSRTNSSCDHADASSRSFHDAEAPPSDPFDVASMTWLLDEAEEPAPQPEQKPRLLLPAATHLVPALKVWCDWLLYNSSLWHPPPSNTDYTSQWFDSWSSVAELATILHGIGEADVSIFTAADVATADRPVEFLPLVLDEDKFLRGYDPLLPAHNLPPMLTDNPAAMARACDWVRLQQLQTVLGKFLCGLEPPVLRLQKTLQGDVFIPAISSPSSSPPPEMLLTAAVKPGSAVKPDNKEYSDDDEDSSEEELDQLEENTLTGDDSMASNINATLRMLWQRKHQVDKLKKRLERKKERKSQSVGVELEVRPRYVVPDTNCFITHLQYLTSLVAQPSPYTLLVPLVVVRELEGLSRGGDCPLSLEEVGEVVEGVPRAEWARLAREFVRCRKHNIKAVTTQGSILTSSDFQEAIVDEMSNDDKILSSCQHFCLPDVTRNTSAGQFDPYSLS
ncbi:DNA/RNA-binding domain Est1-type [Trinorchestia longiramus]|nr:DNA/RNA-binding domain Est1-type [Trinorchestia longiramus]